MRMMVMTTMMTTTGKRAWLLAGVLALLAVGPGSAGADEKLAIPFETYKLDNGLQVILHRDTRLPLVAVSVWYHVGGYHEPPGRSGFAHLFEHMMFQGSAHVGDDQHFAILSRGGASFVNGTTNFDRTNYLETVPSNQLEVALWLESDRMGFLPHALTRKKLDNQRAVVKNERRQGLETQPYGFAREKMWHALFPKPHPYHGRVIGSMEDLDAASVKDVRDFFRTWYAPSNATLTIAGDFDPARVRELIGKYFGTLPGAPAPEAPSVAPVKLTEEVRLHHDEQVATVAKAMIGWHTPRFFAEGDATADILAGVLSGGKAARLQRRLVRELQLAQSVVAYQGSMGAQSVFQVEATARPGVDPNKLIEAIDAVLAEVRDKGVTADEVTRSRNRYETGFFVHLQRLGGFSGRAELLQMYNHYVGDPGYLARDVARYRAVTAEKVKDFANKFLGSARVVMVADPKAAPPAGGGGEGQETTRGKDPGKDSGKDPGKGKGGQR